jgi:rod shape-determining protein MreC
MAVRNSDNPARFSESSSGTVRLIGYLSIAAALMAFDHRSQMLASIQSHIAGLAAPAYWLATAPIRLGRGARDAAADRGALVNENAELRKQLLLAQAGLAQVESMSEENKSLRALLDARMRLGLHAQLAELVEVDLDPYRHRLLIDQGSAQGVTQGQAVIDAHGLVGQVLRPMAERAQVILITDPGHAIPVRVARNGLRAIAYGTGEIDRLELPHIPFSADIVVGDQLLTSGLGGGFPGGIPVAVIKEVRGDDSATFAVAEAIPLAGLTRGNQVLLLSTVTAADNRSATAADFVGPPAPIAAPLPQAPLP